MEIDSLAHTVPGKRASGRGTMLRLAFMRVTVMGGLSLKILRTIAAGILLSAGVFAESPEADTGANPNANPSRVDSDVVRAQVQLSSKELNNHCDGEQVFRVLKFLPVTIDGQIVGLRLLQVKESSLFHDLGLRSGDLIRVRDSAGLWPTQEGHRLIPGICNESPHPLYVERGGEVYSVKVVISGAAASWPASRPAKNSQEAEPTHSADSRTITISLQMVPVSVTKTDPDSTMEPLFSPLDSADSDNPVNPKTGQPYTNRQMKQFDALRKKFPENTVIPRRLSQEEKAAKELLEARMSKIEDQLLNKTVSCEEVNEYYDYKQQFTRDRIQLIEYVLNKSDTSMSEKTRLEFGEARDRNRRTLESLEAARQRFLKECITPG